MKTKIIINLKRARADGIDIPVNGYLAWTPTRRLIMEDFILLPVPFGVTVTDGQAECTVEPTGADWVWRVEEKVDAGIVRYVAVPAVAEINYEDLQDVDPTTFDVLPSDSALEVLGDRVTAVEERETQSEATLVDHETRITNLESGETGGVTKEYVNEADATVLQATKDYSDAANADTLTSAKTYADQSISYASAGLQVDIDTNASDIESLQEQINDKQHFMGYFATNAEIVALTASNGDFAYSAESGTKWAYSIAWADTGEPVPDKTTPLSNAIPLMSNGATGSSGTANEAARADHRHPSDSSKADLLDLQAEATARQNADAQKLSAVSHDTTLTGSGTVADPLKVTQTPVYSAPVSQASSPSKYTVTDAVLPQPYNGMTLRVQFGNANNYAQATLSINGGTAYVIRPYTSVDVGIKFITAATIKDLVFTSGDSSWKLLNVPGSASITTAGLVQLENSLISTAQDKAPTSNVLKAVNDRVTDTNFFHGHYAETGTQDNRDVLVSDDVFANYAMRDIVIIASFVANYGQTPILTIRNAGGGAIQAQLVYYHPWKGFQIPDSSMLYPGSAYRVRYMYGTWIIMEGHERTVATKIAIEAQTAEIASSVAFSQGSTRNALFNDDDLTTGWYRLCEFYPNSAGDLGFRIICPDDHGRGRAFILRRLKGTTDNFETFDWWDEYTSKIVSCDKDAKFLADNYGIMKFSQHWNYSTLYVYIDAEKLAGRQIIVEGDINASIASVYPQENQWTMDDFNTDNPQPGDLTEQLLEDNVFFNLETDVP